MSGLGANRISPGHITRNTARTRHGDHPCLGACVSMSLTTYNLLLVQKKQTRHPHSLLMSHVSLCPLEVVFGDIETFETGFTEHRLARSDDATNAQPRSNAPANSSQILIFVGVSSPKEATSSKGRGHPLGQNQILPRFQGRDMKYFLNLTLPPYRGVHHGGVSLWPCSSRLDTGGNQLVRTHPWEVLVWPSGLSRRPDWISALSGRFQ